VYGAAQRRLGLADRRARRLQVEDILSAPGVSRPEEHATLGGLFCVASAVDLIPLKG
jgi:hypothetical protein